MAEYSSSSPGKEACAEHMTTCARRLMPHLHAVHDNLLLPATTTAPRRLSWGRTASSHRTSAAGASRPGTAQPATIDTLQEKQQQHIVFLGSATQLQAAGCNAPTSQWQQQGCSYAGLQPMSASGNGNTQCGDSLPSRSTSMEQSAQHISMHSCVEVQRATLRAVLAALLQVEDGPCLDHHQLTPQAIAAVARHKAAEACSKAREEAAGAAAAAAKQQLQATHQEAEQKAAKQLAEANTKAATAAEQHSQELVSLQAQLAALQGEKRQLFGKSAQQSRNARQAQATADELQGHLEQLRQQLLRQSKQLEAKEATLARVKLAANQEVAALKDALQQSQEEATEARAKHEQQLKQVEAQHAAKLAELRFELLDSTQLQLQRVSAAHQQALLHQEQQQAAAATASLQQLQAELVQFEQHQQEQCQALLLGMAAALDSSTGELRAAQQQLAELRGELAAVSSDAQQVMFYAAEQQTALQQVQQQLAEVAPGGLLALQEQAETARQEHQDAITQLQDASSQLATLQPHVLRLQQDKQDLLQLLAAADADKFVMQQELAAQAQQHAAAHEKLLAELRDHKQLLAAAVGREQAAAAQAAIATQEQQERQQQQAQQQLMQLALSHQHELEQVLQRLQWLCSAYLSPASDTDIQQTASAPNGGSRQPAEAASIGSNSSAAAALAKLCRVCCLASGDADQVLSARYDAYQQHKLASLPDQQDARPGCDSGSGRSDVGMQLQTTACSASMECVQQQMLQVEAGLLQHMLNLQEAMQLLQQQQQEQDHQKQLQQRTSQNQRPSTASSRCTESYSLAASCCSSGSSRESCDLTGQLLQAMAKDRKQLAQEVKRLQAQQHQQHQGQLRYLLSSRSSSAYTWDSQASPAALATVRARDSTSPVIDIAGIESSYKEVDEVLQLLQGYEVQCCPLERRTPTKVDTAGPPTRELHKRGIGSLRTRMLA